MITLISGAPGTGKTAALIHLINEKWAGQRTIYSHNIPGLQIAHLDISDPHRWHEILPVDSVLIVDECQRVWRRDRSAKVTPDIEAMETHRHEGVDIYLISQNPSLINDHVRALVGRHIHIRDLGFPMGRVWYEWPEATPTAQFKSAPIKKKYKLPKSIFNLYKSSSKHVKPIRSIPKQFFILVACVIGAFFFIWKAYAALQHRISPEPAAAAARAGPASAAASAARGLASAPAAPPFVPQPDPVLTSTAAAEPVLVGCIHMGSRCECIDSVGKSIEVEVKVCHDNSRRTGLSIPYALAVPHGRPASGVAR